jgi:hypothetical protein
MSLENLITDRTSQDVDQARTLAGKAWQDMTAEERAEWLSPMKGAYNSTDLNRVGAALNYVRDRLSASGYLRANAFTAREDWRSDEIPTTPEMSEYLSYVSVVREALAQFRTTPTAPMNPNLLDHAAANAIEQILVDVDALITLMVKAFFYSGDLYAGEV